MCVGPVSPQISGILEDDRTAQAELDDRWEMRAITRQIELTKPINGCECELN